MTIHCQHCGYLIPSVTCQGDFSATVRPAAVYYRGELLALTPQGARILTRLATTDFVTFSDLMGDFGIRRRKSVHVHMTAIRHELPAGTTIENEFGKGYRLVVNPYDTAAPASPPRLQPANRSPSPALAA